MPSDQQRLAGKLDEITHNLTNHPPENEVIADALDVLTDGFIHLSHRVAQVTAPSREQSLALTKLEEASMWAKAAVARHQDLAREPS